MKRGAALFPDPQNTGIGIRNCFGEEQSNRLYF